MSPELFFDEDLKIRPATDIWGLGVIAYKMCSLCTVPEEQGKHIVKDGLYDKLFHKAAYSPDLQTLIFAMINRDPTTRPTAESILKQRCLKEVVHFDREKMFAKNVDMVAVEQKVVMKTIKTG